VKGLTKDTPKHVQTIQVFLLAIEIFYQSIQTNFSSFPPKREKSHNMSKFMDIQPKLTSEECTQDLFPHNKWTLATLVGVKLVAI